MANKKKNRNIFELQDHRNVAELLTDPELVMVGGLVLQEFRLDESSCAEWTASNKLAMDIAKQIHKQKNTPWEKAANIKYPLITTAAIQYVARMYPEIVRNGKTAFARPWGPDPDGRKEKQASRAADFTNYQLLTQDPDWATDTKRLLMTHSIVGLCYKKVYYDELLKRNRSVFCTPDDIIVHRDIKSLSSARRITHRLYVSKNDIVSGVRFGIYSDKILKHIDRDDVKDNQLLHSDYQDEEHILLEQHRYLDLDGDGYEEPYIVTVHQESEIVLRIYRCFDVEGIEVNENTGEIWNIKKVDYFVAYPYLPNPDGSFHAIGLGQLLLPINEAINTLANQLLNSGTLSTQQNGFMARTFKVKAGDVKVGLGRFKVLDVSPDDLKNSVMQMPFAEPSAVLFQMLGKLVETGEKLSSVTDIMQGQQPAGDVQATVVLSLIEQGTKVLSFIRTNLYEAQTDELEKWARLNRLHLKDSEEYPKYLESGIISKEDFSSTDIQILPVSDPSMSSDAHRIARARAMMEMLQFVPPAGQHEILRNWLEALQTPESQIMRIISDPNDPNSPVAQQQAQQAAAAEQEKNRMLMEMELKAEEMDAKEVTAKAQANLNKQLAVESQARVVQILGGVDMAQASLKMDAVTKHTDLAIKAARRLEDLQEEAAQIAEELDNDT